MGFVIRKATKTATKLPPPPQVRRSYRKVTISSTAAENSIPADLIVNWDQTGVRMVPVTDWTMTTRGSEQLSVTGLGDKSFSAINILKLA